MRGSTIRRCDGLTDLARAFPDTTIVLITSADRWESVPTKAGVLKSSAMEKGHHRSRAMSQRRGKLGGINMAVNGFGWHHRPSPPGSDELVAATRDYYLHSIDQFGPARCMFESNFPVDPSRATYGVLWNSFKKIAAGFTR